MTDTAVHEHDAAALADLAENEPVDVDLDGTKVLLVRRGERVWAVAGLCPHKGVPLSKGVVEDGVGPDGRAEPRIVCGLHRAAFALHDGALRKPPACEALASYRVRVEGGRVMVSVPADDEPHPLPAMATRGDDDRHFVVVGAGAAGWRAAEALRREGFEGRVTVVTDEAPLPYDRTDLSKGYIKADEPPPDPVIREEAAIARHGIDVVEASVTGLDPDGRALSLRNGHDRTLRYDRILLATGADARRLDVPGADLPGIHVIRTLADAKALRADLADALAEAKDGGRRLDVAVVGGGFVGLEAASALSGKDDVRVTVVLQDAVPFADLFGEAFGRRMKAEHEEAGVQFETEASVTGFGGESRVSAVRLDGRDPVGCDLVILAVGASPRTGWLPFERDEDGGIAVDEGFRVAGRDDVFAAGDIARVPTPWGHVRIEHWRFAQECGELAARNMLGTPAPYDGTPFFWSMQQIEGSYTYTGHAEGFDSVDGDVEPTNFAAAYVKDGRVDAVLAHGITDEVTALEPRMAGRGPLERGAVEMG